MERAFRKGPNNTLDAGPNDPGSPMGDRRTGRRARRHPPRPRHGRGLQGVPARGGPQRPRVAIDLALQCSPDHPWVTEHPEWFTSRPDGSIAYAENPPKKYQDIYPLNFDRDPVGIRGGDPADRAVLDRLGGRDLQRRQPAHQAAGLLGMAAARGQRGVSRRGVPRRGVYAAAHDAVARGRRLPAVVLVFHWRNTKAELEEFLAEITDEWSAFFRPNLFVNTPDILTEYLQFGGVPAYKIRATVASTASPAWGVYSGYELFEDVARPGSEENIDNEKYQYRPRDFAKAEMLGRSLAPYLARLNAIRREHPALRQLRNLAVHWSDDESILVYSKYLDGRFSPDGGPDGIIVVANVDPHSVRETTVHLDVTRFGVTPGAVFDVVDLLSGQRFSWGEHDYVRLDAFNQPVHILSVQYRNGTDDGRADEEEVARDSEGNPGP
ncbi:MAG: hypothetical protein WDM88_11900 [Galbitalea sp.]